MRGAIFLLLALTLASIEAKAIAVASDYLGNNTLELIEGASKIYGIRLQNPTNDEVGIKLDYDTTFMKAIDYKEVYILPPKTTGYSILFNVTAPKKPGTYSIGYTVSEVEPSGGGGLPIRLKIGRGFKLKIIEDPNKFHVTYYARLAYIAVLLIIGLALAKNFLFRKKSQMQVIKAKLSHKPQKKIKNRKINK